MSDTALKYDNVIESHFPIKKYLREHSFIEPIVKNPFTHKLNFSLREKVKVRFLVFFF